MTDCIKSCHIEVISLRNCLTSLNTSNSPSSSSPSTTVEVKVEGNKCMEELVRWKECCEDKKTKDAMKGKEGGELKGGRFIPTIETIGEPHVKT